MNSMGNDYDQSMRLKRALQAFQAERLKSTFADLRAEAQFRDMGAFFFDRLYGPEDFSFRNASIKKLHQVLDGKVYRNMVSAVTKVIELHDLSDALDTLMVERMIQSGIGVDLDVAAYKRIYRQLDNYDQRVYQILLGGEVTRDFYNLSRKWIVGVSLKTVSFAAHALGMGKIIDFVYEGYQAFRKIRDIDKFIETVKRRELAWHDQIWHEKKPTHEKTPTGEAS